MVSLPEEDDVLSVMLSQGYKSIRGYLKKHTLKPSKLNQILAEACEKDHYAAIEALLEYGANPNSVTIGRRKYDNVIVKDEYLLHWACRKGYIHLIRFLLDKCSRRLDQPDTSGRRAIHYAAFCKQLDVLEYLVSSGFSDVNRTDRRGWTPLHYACFNATSKDFIIIKFLISSNVDPMMRTVLGKTALDMISLEEAFNDGVLLRLITCIDDIVPARRRKEDYRPHRQWSLKLPSSHQDVMDDRALMVRLWSTILQNDDTGLLTQYRDSMKWREDQIPKAFEDSQEFDEDFLNELFHNCYENGLGVYTFVNTTFKQNNDKCDFKATFKELVGLSSGFDNGKAAEVIPSPHKSFIFLAVLCGRFQIVETLLRMRQFDIVPMALLMALIARKLTKDPSFPPQVTLTFKTFAGTAESIAMDAVSRMFLSDTSESKHKSLDVFNLPLKAYGNLTWISLASKAKCNNFLSLQFCQTVLDGRWYGNLGSLTSAWRWACMLCPPMYPVYLNKHCRLEAELPPEEPTIGRKRQFSYQVDSNFHSHKIKVPANSKQLFCSMRHVFQAPSAKFFGHSLMHFGFLILFAYVALNEFHFNIEPAELTCFVFIVGYALEELRQFFKNLWDGSAKEYITDSRNWWDLSALILSFQGFAIRYYRIGYVASDPSPIFEAHETILYIARVFLLTGLLFFSVRILFIVSISSILGPKLKMMGNMLLRDLLPLLVIFAIVLVSFGVVFQGLLYPNGYPTAAKRFTNIETLYSAFKRAFYGMVVAEYSLEELTCTNENWCPNTIGRELVMYFYNVIYILIVNIMLVNLLIALFSNTVSRIDKRSRDHWLAERYMMIEEYEERSILPPPLNIFTVIVELILFCITKCRDIKVSPSSSSDNEIKRQVLTEHLINQAVALRGQRYKLGRQSTTDEYQRTIDTRLRNLEEGLQTLLDKERDRVHTVHTDDSMDEMEKVLSSFSSSHPVLDRHHALRGRKRTFPYKEKSGENSEVSTSV